jgi:hypothetical protein
MKSATMMSNIPDTARDLDIELEAFAAELTSAVYPSLLRRGLRDSWLQVELGLWRAVLETVEKWARKPPPAASWDDLDAWREGILVELTVSALDVALKSGVPAPHLEVARGLSAAFEPVIWRYSHVNYLRFAHENGHPSRTDSGVDSGEL